MFLGFFCVLGLWDNIVCYIVYVFVVFVVKVWLLIGDVFINMIFIVFYVFCKKVMNYNFYFINIFYLRVDNV